MIRIQNIYYMLSYAFQVLNEQGYKQVATEEFDNVAELCAAILIKGVSLQIKRGLGKEYVVQSEPLSSLRGKIDISASVKQQSMLKKQLVCNYDEFSVNSYLNRIIRTTMDVLVRSEISKERKKQLRKLLIYFSEVKPLSRESINWKLQFNKNNQTYQMLISICYLILKGLLQTTSDGSTKLMDFLDEQRMCRLYEKFILEYFKKEHPEVKASASQIPWDTDDGYREMLPVMQSDSRGAPLWWAYAARCFTYDKLPMDEQTFLEKYKSIAREFGMKFYGNGYVCINRFAAGGMSSGVVGEEFVRQGWYELRRRNRLYRSDEVASDTLYLDKVKERIAWYCDTRSTFEYKLNPDFDSNSFLFAFEDTNMNEHQREIVAQLWGLYSGKPKSKKEVAEDMGVTYSRIRQVEVCCLRHILKNKNRNTLIIEK